MLRFSVITPIEIERTGRLESLYRLIDDFRNQTYKNLEHIIVYDGKWPLIQSEIPKIITINNTDKPEHFKGAIPRNKGIDMATGDYIVFADDDDRFHPDYLQAFIDAGINGDNLGVCQMLYLGKRIPGSLYNFPVRGTVGGSCVAIPRKWFKMYPDYLYWRPRTRAADYHLIQRIMWFVKPEIAFARVSTVSVRGGENPVF